MQSQQERTELEAVLARHDERVEEVRKEVRDKETEKRHLA